MARFTTTDRQLGATEFSTDRLVNDPVWLIRSLRQTAWAYEPLRKLGEQLAQNWGRQREPGHWPLAYLAFVISHIPDIQPWLDQTTEQLWREAGFVAKPPYSRVYARFTELEEHLDPFEEAAGRLIQHAKRHEPRIGAHVHFDSTEGETHAALVHVCCKPKRGRRGAPQHPDRVSTGVVREDRQAAAIQPPPEDNKPVVGDAEKVKTKKGVKYVLIKGHWYRLLDETAGVRAYTRGGRTVRFWVGFYNQKAVDHFTGGCPKPRRTLNGGPPAPSAATGSVLGA